MAQSRGRSEVTINFIRDEPADDGLFSDHSNIAEAIARSIETNPDIKVIGLFGRWGSGKSTVAGKALKILKMGKESPFITFSYDAWLHQSDPIRRSFLESLLSALVAAHGLQGEKKWRERLRELNGQVENTDVIESPSLSVDARWITASLLLVPIGAGLLGLDTIKEGLGSSTTAAGIWTLVLGVLLALTPLWVMIALYLYRRPWRTAFSEGIRNAHFWRLTDEHGNATSWLALFNDQPVKHTSTKTFRTGEPTSIEFGRTFQEVMREVTAKKHRLVILIDNLDRVAEAEALQMWATIRSFFLSSHETDGIRHEPYHPVVILPIDRHAVEELFSTENAAAADRNVRAPVNRGASFIDKTFDVTFEVSEPI
jgi:hypothetical protein